MDPQSASTRDPRSNLDAARDAASRGDYQVAAALFSRLVGNPDPELHVAGLLGLADARYRLDDEEGALQGWIAATQGPETSQTWQAWVQLAGARVREGDLVAAARAYREAESRAPYDERAGIASRLGWLNKEMGNHRTANRYFGRARTGAFRPIATYVIIAVTAIVSLYILYGPSPLSDQLGNLLALDKHAVQHGEYWRLLSVTLVHASLIHLGLNMYALWIVGPLAEALYGRNVYVAIYLLAGLGGSIGSYLFIQEPSVGASGAIFGLFGLIFTSTYFHKPALARQARAITSQIGILIVINLVIGFGIGSFGGLGEIDNAAHVGGLLVGGWLGFVLPPRGAATLASFWHRPPGVDGMEPSRMPALIAAGGTLLLGLVLFVALQIKPTWA
jgi:membrane associated rhomboid family serine protease